MMQEGGVKNMDELYTVEEMMTRLKISRDTLYNWMNDGIIPYIQIRKRRRFEAKEVNKALKKLRVQKPFSEVRNYTLSASSGTSSTANTKPLKQLKKFQKRQYKHSDRSPYAERKANP